MLDTEKDEKVLIVHSLYSSIASHFTLLLLLLFSVVVVVVTDVNFTDVVVVF
jgi:hypothetical protein